MSLRVLSNILTGDASNCGYLLVCDDVLKEKNFILNEGNIKYLQAVLLCHEHPKNVANEVNSGVLKGCL